MCSFYISVIFNSCCHGGGLLLHHQTFVKPQDWTRLCVCNLNFTKSLLLVKGTMLGFKAVDVVVWLATQQLVEEGGKVRKFQDRPPTLSQQTSWLLPQLELQELTGIWRSDDSEVKKVYHHISHEGHPEQGGPPPPQTHTKTHSPPLSH